ncbi:LSD1 zinc finger containing protein, putative [Leishmania lindenbergi]|uniref:LSD1 zinc finger containing protein n=1 Tax=Leishmania lindenbergi TaxID=651832 RepID=A0AAW3ARD7_9TRYP
MLFGQLVCYGCQRILTYPLGAVTCRCRLCNTINSAQNLQITCGTCGQELHAPINTLALLCPCCGTVTDIPEELLPPLPTCVNLGGGAEEAKTIIYVSHPTLPPPPRADAQADVSTACPAGSRRASTYPKADGRTRSLSYLRRRLSCKEHEAAPAQRNKEEVVVIDNADGAREVRRAHKADRERRGTADSLAPDPEADASPVVSGTARLAALSRLAPTVMIATRIL